MPGDRIGQVARLVTGIAERPFGESPLAGRRVGLEQAADHQAAAGDGLDPRDVPVGQGPARLTRLEAVVVTAADDQISRRCLGALGDAHGPGGIDQAEVDQVVADPRGQLPAPRPVRGHQQDVPAGQVAGHVGAGGLVHGLVGRGAADAAMLVVFIQRGGIPAAQPQRGLAFLSGCEPDRLGQLHVPEPVREQHHRAAALDGGQLLLVAGHH